MTGLIEQSPAWNVRSPGQSRSSLNEGLRQLSFTDNMRTVERGKTSVLSPEATPDKALGIFATLVRDQEVEGSNPFAPTIPFNGVSAPSGFMVICKQSDWI
jgi:hypothetical protein